MSLIEEEMSKARLVEIYEAAAEQFAARLRDQVGDELRAVIVYGSVARGTAHEESDVDLLIIADDLAEVLEASGRLAYEAANGRRLTAPTTPCSTRRGRSSATGM